MNIIKTLSILMNLKESVIQEVLKNFSKLQIDNLIIQKLDNNSLSIEIPYVGKIKISKEKLNLKYDFIPDKNFEDKLLNALISDTSMVYDTINNNFNKQINLSNKNLLKDDDK